MFIHLFVPPLRKTLKRPGEIPQGKSIYLEDILKNCADVLLDGTERPVQRPSDHQRANEYYSGKKTHSVKNSMLVLPDLRVVWPSQT
ncbi:hypothetical protein Barb6_03057 [Bacteroidales bacterium Barb6]|nr:hypothetical protein Barb6_03057 [Bacteroidales bacterium Barb6]